MACSSRTPLFLLVAGDGNVEFAYYPSGHMIYLNVDALKQLKSDLTAFYARAIQ